MAQRHHPRGIEIHTAYPRALLGLRPARHPAYPQPEALLASEQTAPLCVGYAGDRDYTCPAQILRIVDYIDADPLAVSVIFPFERRLLLAQRMLYIKENPYRSLKRQSRRRDIQLRSLTLQRLHRLKHPRPSRVHLDELLRHIVLAAEIFRRYPLPVIFIGDRHIRYIRRHIVSRGLVGIVYLQYTRTYVVGLAGSCQYRLQILGAVKCHPDYAVIFCRAVSERIRVLTSRKEPRPSVSVEILPHDLFYRDIVLHLAGHGASRHDELPVYLRSLRLRYRYPRELAREGDADPRAALAERVLAAEVYLILLRKPLSEWKAQLSAGLIHACRIDIVRLLRRALRRQIYLRAAP